jgi:16S rRNA (guanine527-N7)-methyltransferase
MEIILKYFPELTEIQRNQFVRLQDIYTDWNAKINLISRQDIGNLYTHHVLHSLALAKLITFKPDTKILDVGTGGGFPGIPLAIMFPDVKFHLVDSIGKKIKVVEDIINQLGLSNVTCEQARAEQLRSKYDFVVSRAVTTLPEFVVWIQGKINKQSRHSVTNGMFYLKGGNLEEEIKPFKKKVTLFEISDYFKEDYFKEKHIIYLPFG